MNDYRDTFERQLIEASERLAEPATQAGKAARWRTRRAAVVLGVGALCAGTAVAATAPWSPLLGEPAQPAKYRPTPSASTPPQSQMRLLSVLRRPAGPADRDEAVRSSLRFLGPSSVGVRTAYIRRVGTTPDGSPAILVPVESWHRADGVTIDDAVCLVIPDPKVSAAAKSCWSSREISAGTATASYGLDAYGLVPDGVSRIVDGDTTIAAVADNFYAYRSSQDSTDPEAGVPARPLSLLGLNAAGHTVIRLRP